MPSDYHSSQVQSWFASVQRELGRGALVDFAYLGNRADDLLLFANYNQAPPNNTAGTIPLQQRRPIPEFGDITVSFNGGKSRYKAFQGKLEWRMGSGFMLLQLADAVADEGHRRRLARESPPATSRLHRTSTTWTPISGAAYHQPFNSTTSLVWDVPVGRGRAFMAHASTWVDVLLGGLATRRLSTACTRATRSPSPTRLEHPFLVSGISAGLPWREHLSA